MYNLVSCKGRMWESQGSVNPSNFSPPPPCWPLWQAGGLAMMGRDGLHQGGCTGLLRLLWPKGLSATTGEQVGAAGYLSTLLPPYSAGTSYLSYLSCRLLPENGR